MSEQGFDDNQIGLEDKKRLSSNDDDIIVIEPKSGWNLIDLKDLLEYKDLIYFMVWRDIKVLYAQTILGFLWAIFQPLTQIILFTIIFGKVAKISSDGIPYFLFTTVAIIPWTFMSQSMSQSSQSLVANQTILGKVYFPRLIFPLTGVFSKLVNFSISLLIVFAALLYYKVMPTWNLLLLPLFILLMVTVAAGIGILTSSLAIRFRDVRYAMEYVLQTLMYTAPIVYTASSIPEKWRFLYSLNPIVGTIEGFRACLLGLPIPWSYILPGTITALATLLFAVFYFRRMEKVFVDVI